MLLAGSVGGAALGCGDPRRAAEAIAREEPIALSRAVEPTPGGGNETPEDGRRVRTGEASAAGAQGERAADDGADEAVREGGERGAASSRGRRRRSGSTTDARGGAGRDGGSSDGSAAAPALKVTRLVMARDVVDREPMEPATTFAGDQIDRICAFVELTNEARAASEITVAFTPKAGGSPLRIRLDVGAQRRWRTWAATRKARAPGEWEVAVSDAEGHALARTSFTITK